MPYKILFTDIDGTLLDKNRDVSAFTISEIQRIKDYVPIVLVSARMPKQMHHIQDKLGVTNQPLICYNGALVIANNKILHNLEIPGNLLERIISYNEQISAEKFHLSLFNNDEWYVEQYDYWAKREENNTRVTPEIKSNIETLEDWKNKNKGAHKITCMGEAHLIEEAFQYFTKEFGNDLHLYRSKDTYIEIAPKQVSKLTGIQKLLDLHFKLSIDDAIAFGDNYNDTEMINAVGHGVAVANARDEVKAVANAITLHHKEDGVAKHIAKLFKD